MNSYAQGSARVPAQSAPVRAESPRLESPIRERRPAPASPFSALGVSPPLLRALAEEGYLVPTPIQEQAIPSLIDGRDLLGCAQTGTGKTAAFVLPMLERLQKTPRSGKIRALVLTPTRELALQINERASAYGRHVSFRHTVVYGGVGQRPQEQALAARPDLLVATPGRLLDLMNQGFVRLDGVEIFVLDEADRMLDMGFIHDVRRVIAALPARRQNLLFSATMPRDIAALAANILRDPVRVSVTPEVTTADGVIQSVYFVSKNDKRALLERVLLSEGVQRTLVFTRTKHGANRVVKQLASAGIEAAAIHGNKSQGARERALGDFRQGRIPVLVATDIAARGIDVEAITHVVNFDLPNIPESYVHRIGRTGRAGATGIAISLCDPDERIFLRDIERLIKKKIPVAGAAPEPVRSAAEVSARSEREPMPPAGTNPPSLDPRRSRRVRSFRRR